MTVQPLNVKLNTTNFSSMSVNNEQTMTNPLFDFGFEPIEIDTKESDKQQAKTQLMEIVRLARNIKKSESGKEAKKTIENKMKSLREFAEIAEINLDEILSELLENVSDKEQKQIAKTIGMKKPSKAQAQAQVEEQTQDRQQNFFGTMLNIFKSRGTSTSAAVETDYSRPIDLTLTSDKAKNAVSLAICQLGVKELTRNNDGKEIDKFRQGRANGDPWCASFVSWCYGDGQNSKNAETFGYNAGVLAIKTKAQKAGFYSDKTQYTGREGDLLIWDKTKHIAIVKSVSPDGKKITFIAGNHGDKVAEETYDIDDSRIVGFVRMNEWLNA